MALLSCTVVGRRDGVPRKSTLLEKRWISYL